jgi:hypothetical protein
MSARHVGFLLVIIALASACSRERGIHPAASPTAPSAHQGADLRPVGGGVSGPAVVAFPPRNEAIDFRSQLETKYASGLGRSPAQVYVDPEGEVVWIGEYDRYRVNGCDHNTATQYVLTQVDGAAASPVCAVLVFPETAAYPPRDQVVDFRRQLGNKYQSMGRNAQSAVDPDGAAIWTSEYYRYRTSGCDHASAVQKVMTQIDGNAAPETCVVTCVYRASIPVTAIPAAGGTFNADVERTSGSCPYVAISETEWISLVAPITGSGRGVQRFNALANPGLSRTGWIRIQWPAGSTYVEVKQNSLALAFQFFDPATSTSPTTECQLRTTATICTVTALTSGLPNPIATYDWRVEYAYGGTRVHTQTSSLSSFSFTESCGVSASGGSPIPLTVRLLATDTAGNTATIYSGQGSQPALQLRSFNCS